jgi:sulfite reductase alpha subunit-like flavoprotein
MSTKDTIYVLYGSQTGNSEFIAKEFHSKLQENNIISICLTLNESKKIALKDVAKAVVIVCSTTGNGDCPENGDAWWRSIKLRSIAKDFYEGVPYAVLGLGDTNYDKFCQMGKSIDKRFHELGGIRIMNLICADEATGLESTVEQWKEDIFEKIKELNEGSVLE